MKSGFEFDPIDRASRELDDLTGSIDLEDRQAVCGGCNYVYWRPLGYCPTCAENN